jgi:hypothetical protein
LGRRALTARAVPWFFVAALVGCSEGTGPPATNVVASQNSAPAAPSARSEPAERCALTGESTDDDLSGLRVHSEPRLSSPVVGRLYPGADPESFYHDEGPKEEFGLVGAQFTIDRVNGDWLHITDIDPVSDGIDPQGRAEPTLNFTGTGWVHTSKVRLFLTSVVAHQRPDADSPVVTEARFSNGEDARHILECRGSWARLEYVPPREESSRSPRVTGWMPSQSNRTHADIMRASLEREATQR